MQPADDALACVMSSHDVMLSAAPPSRRPGALGTRAGQSAGSGPRVRALCSLLSACRVACTIVIARRGEARPCTRTGNDFSRSFHVIEHKLAIYSVITFTQRSAGRRRLRSARLGSARDARNGRVIDGFYANCRGIIGVAFISDLRLGSRQTDHSEWVLIDKNEKRPTRPGSDELRAFAFKWCWDLFPQAERLS